MMPGRDISQPGIFLYIIMTYYHKKAVVTNNLAYVLKGPNRDFAYVLEVIGIFEGGS